MNIFGFGNYEGLFGEDEMRQLNNNALISMGLTMAGNSQAVGYKPGFAQAALQGYSAGQGAGASMLQNKVATLGIKEKMEEMKRKELIRNTMASIQKTGDPLTDYAAMADAFGKLGMYDEQIKYAKAVSDLTPDPVKPPTFTGNYGNIALNRYGTNDPAQLTADQRTELDGLVQQARKDGSPKTNNYFGEQKTFENETKLRNEFTSDPNVVGYYAMKDAYGQLEASLMSGSAIGDTAAATKLMKLLDPGSVVRESELGIALNATGMLDKYMNYANRIATGEMLTPAQREDFLALGQSLMKSAENSYKGVDQYYRGLATDYQFNPGRVVKPFIPTDYRSLGARKAEQAGKADPLGLR